MNNSSVQLNYPKQKRELVTPSLISIWSKRWSKTHLNGSRCTQRFSSHLWRIGGCFPAHTVQQSLIQQEIKCHEASVIHCVTVTGCPPVSVLQSNRMRGNRSHVQTEESFIWPKHSHPFLHKCFDTCIKPELFFVWELLYSVSTKMLISVAKLKWPGLSKTSYKTQKVMHIY